MIAIPALFERPVEATAQTAPVTESASLYRRIFADRPERSLRLRVIAMMATLWAGLSLISIGVSPVIPLASMAVVVVGHYVSWKRRGQPALIISIAIGIFIIALGIYMRTDLVSAIRGDRMPMAFFLLATAAASAFDLRTRAGLYTQLIASGIVMFFASELAFGSAFAPVAAVFGVLFLLFLAMAYLEDEFDGAEVVWFRSKAAISTYWVAAGGGVLLLAIVSFFILPWNSAQTPQAARFTILPVTTLAGGEAPAISPTVARDRRDQMTKEADALLASAAQAGGNEADTLDAPGGASADLIALMDGDLMSLQELTDEPLSMTARVGEPLDPPAVDGDAESLVMYVRSPVSSYWRGRTFDDFDPNDGPEGYGKWYATVQDELADPIAGRRALSNFEDAQRYLQTFFPHRDFGHEVVTGYRAVAGALPRDDNYRPDISSGSIYQVVSVEPDFDAESLREDTTRWQGEEYARIPEELRSLFGLAEELTAGKDNDFDRATAIAAYLKQLEYVEQAGGEMRPRAPVDDLIFGERAGSAVDFATAMTLLARAAGMPARVATGYLPGEYNALSGANKITEADRHAWAEINFTDAGWVPFDAAPRPDLPVLSDDAVPPSGLGKLLDLRLGDTIASGATHAPMAIWNGIQRLIESAPLIGAVLLLAGTIGSFAYYFRNRRQSRAGRAPTAGSYAELGGEWRVRVLDAFARAEASVARAGFRRRARSEPYRDYADAAGLAVGGGGGNLRWLARAAWQAAYSPRAEPGDLPQRAQRRLDELRAELRVRHSAALAVST